jgi:hypothetical protein
MRWSATNVNGPTSMNKVLAEYMLVRVVKLIQPLDDYDPWRINQRPPRIGEIGCLIDTLRAPGWPDKYLVEYSTIQSQGCDIWLAEFFAEELEPVD